MPSLPTVYWIVNSKELTFRDMGCSSLGGCLQLSGSKSFVTCWILACYLLSLCHALVSSVGVGADGAVDAPSPAELTTADKGVSADKYIVCVVIYQSTKLKFHQDGHNGNSLHITCTSKSQRALYKQACKESPNKNLTSKYCMPIYNVNSSAKYELFICM